MGNFIEDIIEKDLASGVVKKIITRFPPEPNGYLHIGHAKSICLNMGLAKKYKGKCNLRFDDTNPVKEDSHYVDSILKDVEWLGLKVKPVYASDYFDTMYKCAVKLIEKGLAYVDNLSAEQTRQMRGTLTTKGTDSPNRNNSVEKNLSLFNDMKNGKVEDGAMTLRAKIDMSSPNMNMRDPVIYRVVKATHHRTGDKWCIYPMYDFAHPIGDAVEKVSHSCCTLEFADHRPLYDWVIKNCEFDPPPHQYEFARLNIERTIMSKRYLKELVDNGTVTGWDDPRMPTLAGLRRRGYTASALHDFCDKIGVAKAGSEVENGFLESCIREELNTTADRAMAVLDPLELVITNKGDDYNEECHFEYPQNGKDVKRKIYFSNRVFIDAEDFMVDAPSKYHRLKPDGVVRLKGAYIVRYVKHDTDANGKVTRVYAEVVEGTKSGSDTGVVKAKGVIQWVNAKTSVPIKACLYDHLLTEENTDKDFKERLNPNSLVVKNGYAEPYIKDAKGGDSFQFLRVGYFVKDNKDSGLTFNRIVGLKDNAKAKALK